LVKPPKPPPPPEGEPGDFMGLQHYKILKVASFKMKPLLIIEKM